MIAHTISRHLEESTPYICREDELSDYTGPLSLPSHSIIDKQTYHTSLLKGLYISNEYTNYSLTGNRMDFHIYEYEESSYLSNDSDQKGEQTAMTVRTSPKSNHTTETKNSYKCLSIFSTKYNRHIKLNLYLYID